ncbi:uncharacterized protein BXZ73DRAFT_43885 [Epithele typhae]|uniref:uncharacterized protein n=1 Tax=Epithele typhae TaxID=378194 RepID=UPI002008C506|nr:uncharacterized protein BXZ73DRAFT_43885 [Epithele typhae]KAH9939360.1 hypothetical protein BXZ73DRAFT_43885 [Epithele typhae]
MHKCAKCTTVLPAENPKRCYACREVCYCIQKCQQEHWPLHIFDCKPGQPISTVYYLARAVHNDFVPGDPQTRLDYGFDKVAERDGRESEEYLLYLYTAVLKTVSPQDLRRWQRKGRLAHEIRSLFESMPPDDRGEANEVFLDYEYAFEDPDDVDPSSDADPSAESHMDRLYRNSWIHAGGAPDAPKEEIEAAIHALSPRARLAHHTYTILLARELPMPLMPAYLLFGFVTAGSGRELSELGKAYGALVRACAFDEFLAAFNAARVPALFRTHGVALPPRPRAFEAMMSEREDAVESVWYLKAHVDILLAADAGDADPERFYERKPRAQCGDYGYCDVRDEGEAELLDELYVELFGKAQKGMDPLELHRACMDGKLVEYVGRFVELGTHAAVYKRLLNKRRGPARRKRARGASVIESTLYGDLCCFPYSLSAYISPILTAKLCESIRCDGENISSADRQTTDPTRRTPGYFSEKYVYKAAKSSMYAPLVSTSTRHRISFNMPFADA